MSAKSPFDRLGLPCVLLLDEELVKKHFQERSKEEHPDRGGDADGFAKLNEAFRSLSNPTMRLRSWLKVKGLEIEERGAIQGDLVDQFSVVAELLAKADELIKKRVEAISALSKALLESDVFSMRELIESKIDELIQLRDQIIKVQFLKLEKEFDAKLGGEVLRALAFLDKWVAQLRERFAQLW